ncbi:MAG TPA: chitobiase/beta-hexosaminidase C-terminal domain-containing protein, partial [Opitutaceae bacterium]|nr:chitobiase/beta-hexosaminidase C-terminal domain-containing protein [Opitutaceae bacterium]
YSGPVPIASTTTLQAIAYGAGLTDSTITRATYTITLPSAGAPAFSPAAGTYSSAQSVTITSATSGASIRYTTDGSTPSETAGTVYSGPISISNTASPTTLKAIAYKAGFADSSVTSGIYTITTVPPPTFNFEAESLSPAGTGATVSISNDANASGGVVEFLNSTAAGQKMTFTTPAMPAGTYQVQLRYKSNTTRGIHSLTVDGIAVGTTLDQYATSQAYLTKTFGNVTLTTSGAHTIVMTVTGKNSAATQFYLTADKFTFVGQ